MSVACVKGSGWLRTSFASSTARYEIRMREGQEEAWTTPADGVLQAELAIMVEALASGVATLVLDTEHSVRVSIRDLTPAGLSFDVIEFRRLDE